MHYWFTSYGNIAEMGILPIGAVASGRVCACSLRMRLVFKPNNPPDPETCLLNRLQTDP